MNQRETWTLFRNTLLKIFKGTPFYFPYITVLNTGTFNPHLKAIHNDPECPLLLYYLNNVSKITDFKKFDKGNVFPKSMKHFFAFLENNEVKAFFWKSTDSWK